MNGKFSDPKLVLVTVLVVGSFILAVIDSRCRPGFVNMSYMAIGAYVGRQLPTTKR